MKRKYLFLLSILSALLLTIPFYKWGSGIVMMIAFIPLFFITDHFLNTDIRRSTLKASGFAALTFLIWNTASTYWIMHASLPGMFMAEFISTLFMSLTFLAFFYTSRKLGQKTGMAAFILYWICYEMFFMNGDLSWSWMILGNAFAKDVKLIQWYEHVGAIGGTFWILLINMLIFSLMKHFLKHRELKSKVKDIVLLSVIILLPIISSLIRYYTYKETGEEKKVLVLQPNIDPYREKFGSMSVEQQVNLLIDLAETNMEEDIDYVVAPETVMDYVWLNNFERNNNIKKIRAFSDKHPNSDFVFGATTLYRYAEGEELSETVRKFANSDVYYDVYNSAIQIDSTEGYQLYHKSMLVVGVEKMPYKKLIQPISRLILDLGGTVGGRGTQDYRGVFKSSKDSTLIAPVICFESAFGGYMTDYIKNGANLIFVITNDGWWRNTPGYKQHLSFSSLRAIESRRSIARSANTGISAIINQRGDILQQTDWWERDTLTGTIKTNDKITTFVKYGDFIGRISIFFSILIFIMAIVNSLKSKVHGKNN